MLGIGIGIILATLAMSGVNIKKRQLTDIEIIQKAKKLGMDFPEEFKVIPKTKEGKNKK